MKSLRTAAPSEEAKSDIEWDFGLGLIWLKNRRVAKRDANLELVWLVDDLTDLGWNMAAVNTALHKLR